MENLQSGSFRSGQKQPAAGERRLGYTDLLITGGGGQLGRAFARAAASAACLSRQQLDVTDPAAVRAVFEQLRPSVVVNAAAYTAVDAAEANPGDAYRINAEGAAVISAAAESAGALMVQVSTDYVYPGTKPAPYVEEDETEPLSVYGKSKLEGEYAVRSAASRWLIVRTSWVFGDGKNFIRSILAAARTQKSLNVVADQVGRPTYAGDLAAGILGLVADGATGIFHLAGGGDPASWAELAETALGSAGSGSTVVPVTTRDYFAGANGPVAQRPANSVLDCSKAAALGVQLPPWRESVAAYVLSEVDNRPC